MALVAYVGGVAVGVKRIRMRATGDNGIPGLSQNANGESAQGGIIFDDPNETMTVTGWMPVVVEESDCVGHERIFTGYIADRTYGRGAHYRADSERQIDTTINDTMVLLQTDVFLAADNPNRPAETDTARMAWLLGTPPMDGRIFDLGLVTVGIEHYDAANFLHQTPFDVLNDLSSARGNTFFTYWDDDEGKIGLYYDTPIVTAFTSDLSFSNVPTDLVLDSDGEPAGPVYFAYLDPTMRTRPDEVYCRVIYKYKGGTILVHSQPTHDYFFSTGGPGDVPEVGHRTINVENDRVGLSTTATSFATRLLEHYSVERQEVNFTTRIRAIDIGLIKPGMRTGLRFDHLPDLSTQQYYRVEQITIAQSEGRRDWYDAAITASVHGLGLPPGTGGGSTDVFPPGPPPAAGPCSNEGGNVAAGTTVTMDPGSNSTVNGVRGFYLIGGGGLNDLANWGTLGSGGSHSGACCSNWWGGGPTWWQYNDDLGSSISLSRIQVVDEGGANANYVGISHGGLELWASDDGTTYHKVVSVGEWTDLGSHIFEVLVPPADRTHRYWGFRYLEDFPGGGGGFWDGFGTFGWAIYECLDPTDSTSNAPTTGQPWGPVLPNETPDGSTTIFTLPDGYTFAVNTLRVYVDRLDQTAAVTSYDGTAQPATFTLGFAPHVGELVEVYGTET